jgi:hypothetical protein
MPVVGIDGINQYKILFKTMKQKGALDMAEVIVLA